MGLVAAAALGDTAKVPLLTHMQDASSEEANRVLMNRFCLAPAGQTMLHEVKART